jgi:RNA ligase
MFPTITHLSDVQPHVADKKEISFLRQPNGVTIGCYLFMDSHTFDSPSAIECRGIAFDSDGKVVSRPLHKFFNLGERVTLTQDALLAAEAAGEIHGVYEKIDGSMLATAWVNGQLTWRSKKSFGSDVVRLTQSLLETPEHAHVKAFATDVASRGLTAIFEFTSPDARIVVGYSAPSLRLLHVRDNTTGAYVLLDPTHDIHGLVASYGIECVRAFSGSLTDLLASLETMTDMEGFVVQFKSGDMVKVKCPWYLRYHRSVTFLRERDIAMLALNEELDDVKQALRDLNIDLSKAEAIEQRLKDKLVAISDEVEAVYAADHALERKDFALKHRTHPLFGLIMTRYQGKSVDVKDFYLKHHLKTDFSLTSIADATLADALE